MFLEIALALTLQDLGWLAGSWQVTQGTTECTEEQWTAPSSNLLVGMSRTVVGGRTRSFEFMRIEARADGIYFVAQPGGKPPVDFKLASESASELVFVNPGHADRLKRLIYRREADGNLTARVELEEEGRPLHNEYTYEPVARFPVRCGAK